MKPARPAKSTAFWRDLPRPFFALAPMANVTDAAFRKLFAKYGKPDVTWTEFVSADGLTRADEEGRQRLLADLAYSPKERPVLAQLFTGNPDAMRGAAKLAAELGFDGIDINMGCPDRAVERQGGGASLIRNQATALKVIEAARKGAGGIPVSVKTRIGYNTEIIDEWIGKLLALRPALPALTVHLRTRKEMSEVAAHWELMPRIVALRDRVQADLAPAERTLILGNGDVASLNEGRDKALASGCDGVMIGRGIFGTPWFFERLSVASRAGTSAKRAAADLDPRPRTPEERLAIMLEHTRLFARMYDGTKGRAYKNFATMKKHFKAYVSGWDGAKELRAQLMEAEDAAGVKKIVVSYVKQR